MPGVPIDDVVEVSNYVAALNYGLHRLRKRPVPAFQQAASRDTWRPHAQRAGGNARYVPPPHTRLTELMSNLEHFLHDEPTRTPALLKAGLAHAQFETIHPFLDGNGRLGRLLVTLLLCAEDVFLEPTLYLSLYFKAQPGRVLHPPPSRTGSERVGALDGVLPKRRVRDRATSLRERAETHGDLPTRSTTARRTSEAAGNTLQVHAYLQHHVFLRVPDAVKALPMSAPTIQKSVDAMEQLGIVREITGKVRNRIWVYGDYLDTLSEEI